MLSVIIPTMWKYEPFVDFLGQVLDQKTVDEVIIINNDVEMTPNSEVLKHPKIRMHNCEENIYVAPAWNLGASLARNDKLAFLSDDLECNINVFDKVCEFLDNENVGIVAIVTPYLETTCYARNYTDNTIEIIDSNLRDSDGNRKCSEVGMGNLFFIRKELWKDIPGVKIFHGEVLQWNRIENIGKINHLIINCYAKTPWHVTWTKMSEEEKYAKEISKYQILDQQYCESIQYRYW